MKPYLQLQKLSTAVKKAQYAAEDAAPHLLDHVEDTAKSLWQQIKDAFAADFEQTLVKMKWPDKDISLEGPLEQEWSAGVERLLDLQDPELKAREDQDPQSMRRDEPLVLIPVEVMVKPLELRFKYHFDGDRPTNRIDKVRFQ